MLPSCYTNGKKSMILVNHFFYRIFRSDCSFSPFHPPSLTAYPETSEGMPMAKKILLQVLSVVFG